MQRYLRLRAVPALLFIVAAASPCWSFSLHPSPALPGSFSPATSCVFPSASSHVGAAARRGGGVVGLGMKRKNGASGQQQGLPGGRDGGGRGSEKVAGARADQKYAYVQGGFAERQAPTQGNNTSMYSAFDSALRASSYNMFCSPLKPVSAPSAFQATKGLPG
ncbi:hypothetical protein T484DRAFT_1867750 [Baffinella frigidus]|nr:hypothetical protein T484DRAFT_1867750 [Cryptophyta sp. CCMP2293]